MTRFRWMVVLFCAAIPVLVLAREPEAGFTLRDDLNRTWRNECVQFPLSRAQQKAVKEGQSLVGPDGKAVLYQILPEAQPATDATRVSSRGESRIAFLADLDPFKAREYRFTPGISPAATDLKIEETADRIRMFNDRTGISIRKKLPDAEGPIESVRLNSGQWIGGSRCVITNQPLTSYTVEVRARGPVFAEVVCRALFGGTNEWSLTFHLQANEPVVLVEEVFSLRDDSRFVVSLGRNFAPDWLFFRENRRGVVTTEKFASAPDGPVGFTWEPWLRWWLPRHGKWFGLYNQQSPDLLLVAARDSDVWVDPHHPKSPAVSVAPDGKDIVMSLPLEQGRRHWMIGALSKDACLASLKEKELIHAPLPQQYVIKYEFPLDRVKEYVLDWPRANEPHPRLYVTQKDVARFRKTFQPNPDLLARHLKEPLISQQLDGPVSYYLGSSDPKLGRKLAGTAINWLQTAVDMYLKQDAVFSFGFAPHHQTMITLSLGLADAILSSHAVTAEEARRIRAQAAFLGYTVSRPDYWSPERHYSANPNMTTFVAGYQAVVGCFIQSHPRARAWVETSMKELKDEELETWSDSNGGWLEAPGYALASYNYLFAAFLMTHNSGFNEYLYHPRMKKIMQWLAKISTPPDSRLDGFRHLPSLGNTWKFTVCPHFSRVASLWKRKDPRFAAEMQWMFQQQGSYPSEVGGFSGTLQGYNPLLLDTNIVAETPHYGSELFPKTGVVLRNQYPSDRETMLHMIQGDNHAHYDMDSGSIYIWGKGRIVADEFGYYAQAPVEDQSMVETPLAGGAGCIHVQDFTTSDRFDYVRGILDGWTRQIAFVKAADPLGPNYFVVADSLRTTAPATWRMWFPCESISLGPNGASVTGKEDVDTDLFFLRPAPVSLKTEQKTKSTYGLIDHLKYGKHDWTQTGVIAPMPQCDGFSTVIYPRLKTEKPPTFTSLANGNVVRVDSSSGIDYVFLAAHPFKYQEGDVSFEGTTGAITLRGNELTLALGAAGSVTCKGETLKSDKATTRTMQAR